MKSRCVKLPPRDVPPHSPDETEAERNIHRGLRDLVTYNNMGFTATPPLKLASIELSWSP
jgi:hypothetical protein